MPKKEKKKLRNEEIKEIENIEILTNEFSNQSSIRITFNNGEVDNLWYGSVASRIRSYSENEIEKILEGCKSFLTTIDKIPAVFNEIVEELEDTIRKRE